MIHGTRPKAELEETAKAVEALDRRVVWDLADVRSQEEIDAVAAAGMTAIFNTPIAAILLAVELLLFEWKPRSAIPVALASAAAGAARRYILGLGPLFPVPQHAIFIGPQGLAGCVIAGLLAGALSALLTLGVYAAEDGLMKLPIPQPISMTRRPSSRVTIRCCQAK